MLVNARAGRGRAVSARDRLGGVLASHGHRLVCWEAGQPRPGIAFDVLCVLGGDGTIHHALGDLVESGAALYHYPMGTENLFAREFGHRADPDALLTAIDAWEIGTIDLGLCEGALFAVMASVGPDASIIHRVHAHRRGRISRASYLVPVLHELARPCLPKIWLRVDGHQVLAGVRGLAVAANCRHYGFRLNPAPDARMDDGLLDIVFLPISDSLHGLTLALACRRGTHLARAGIVHERGKCIEIGTNQASPCWQADGEMGGTSVPARGERMLSTIRLEVRPGCARVLRMPEVIPKLTRRETPHAPR